MSYYQQELTRYEREKITYKYHSKPSIVRLHELITRKYLQKGEFILSSGETSNKYFDIKSILTNRIDCNLLKDVIDSVLYDLQRDYKDTDIKLKFKTIVGLELGGALLVASLKTLKKKCFIRKTERKHGLTNMIIGNPDPKSSILIIDDVITSCHTVQSAIHLLEFNKYKVAGILCVVNRYTWYSDEIVDNIEFEYPWPKEYQGKKYQIFSLFKESDFTN